MSDSREREKSSLNGTERTGSGRGTLPEGTVLNGRYKLEKVLGRGGFGITYKALDMNVQVDVAVKEYLTEPGEEPERAVREAQISASLYDLEGIVAVRDYFIDRGIAYIVMEYVQGISIKQYIAQHGRMDGKEVLAGMKPLLKSIRRIHEKGIVHRDISADNLMITQDGKLKLIDFGAASLLDPKREEHTILIKRGFVPVEQYRSEEKIDPWTDVYSLCATMYFMITGMVPEDAMERWISDKLTDLADIFGTGLVPEQSKAIMKGLAVRKEDRYQDVVQLAEVLYDEHVMRQNLWFRTEELPHQMLSGGHTQTVRREAAAFLKKSDPQKKMIWRVAAGAVIFAAVVVLWIYLGGPGSRGQKKGLQPEKAAVSVTMQPAGTDGVTSSVQPDEAGDTTSSPSGKEDNTTSTSRSDEPASAKPQLSDGAGKSDGKNSATTNNTGSKAASNKTPARHAGADRQSSTKTGTGNTASKSTKSSAGTVSAKPAKKPAATKKPSSGSGKDSNSGGDFEGDLDDLLQ